MSYLQVTDMRKDFGNLEVLRGISFELNKGEVLAIIGASGSGKTTLLRCLNFLETPDEGKIYIEEELIYDAAESKSLTDSQLRDKRLNFGLVFQSFNLFPQYNVLKNITLAPVLLKVQQSRAAKKLALKEFFKNPFAKGAIKELNGQRKKVKAEKAAAAEDIEKRARALIKRVGLSDKIESLPCELSGGQSQRVAIARALALNPKVLCFDEPTSALDPELTGEVLKVIKSLKNKDNTMIIVTHEMEFARKVADKVIFMTNGIIEEMGTPEEVFGNTKSDKTKAFLLKEKM